MSRTPEWPRGRRQEGLTLLADRSIQAMIAWRRVAIWSNVLLFSANVALSFLAPTWLVLLMASLIVIVAIVVHQRFEQVAQMPLLWPDGSRHPLPPEKRS